MSDAINNGGPAFPLAPVSHHGNVVVLSESVATGMTLRDYFAAKAMPIAWEAYDKGYTGQPECVEQSIAHHAYQIADAMLRARESK